jgi:hypothetical protein
MPWAYRNRLFIAVSPSTATSLEELGVDPRQIRIVPNGVDLDAPTFEKSKDPLFLAVGRLVAHKRIDTLLPIWDRVREQTGGRLVIVGDGPEAERLQAMAGPGVELAGHVSEREKQRLLAEAWLLLHPAAFEGWGLVITEAAAAGTATLAFDVPGVRDSVAHGQSGVLVKTPVEMAAEWVALANDAPRRAALDKGARRRAARFSWDLTVERFLAVADEAIARPSRPTRVPATARVAPVAAASTTKTPAVSIIVPAYNEAGRIPDALPELVEAVRSLDSEIIFVDDGSTDGTAELAASILRDARQPVLLRHGANRGKGAAVRTGVSEARGRKIVFMDADMATDLRHLPEILEALDDAPVVVGSRAAPGSVTTGATRRRAYMGFAFNHWARAVSGARISDFQCGFKAFRAPAAKLLFDLCQVDGFAFDVEVLGLAHQFGYRTIELPVRWHAVAGGHIRPLRDAPRMGVSVVGSRLRWTHRRTLAAIRAAGLGHRDPLQATAALTARLPHPLAVFPWETGALALLPFVDAPSAAQFAVRLQEDLPDYEVRSAQLVASELLAPSARLLRSAISAA